MAPDRLDENGNDWKRRLFLRALAAVLRSPLARGRVTISEFFYRRLPPKSSIVEMRVNDLPVLVDLSQQEARYIYFGAFERDEVRFMRRWVKSGNIALDVGANVGYLTAILAGAVGPKGKVYAFEPNPVVFSQLRVLADASQGAIEAFRYAVTDEVGNEPAVTRFYVSPDHPMWSSTMAECAESSSGEIEVPAISLSEFCGQNELARVDFIKIDVEGGEAGVLRGMHRFLVNGGRPAIMCEVASGVDAIRAQSLAAVEKFLLEFDYAVFQIANRGNLTPTSLKEIERQSVTVNLVFLPASVRSGQS
jgi:FkbM family methyltransferase